MTAIAPLTTRAAWKALDAHYQKIRALHLRPLFADDATRGERMAVEASASTSTTRSTASPMRR